MNVSVTVMLSDKTWTRSSRSATLLTARGVVELSRDPADGRESVGLMVHGSALNLTRVAEAFVGAAMECATPDDRSALAAVAVDLVDLVERLHEHERVF